MRVGRSRRRLLVERGRRVISVPASYGPPTLMWLTPSEAELLMSNIEMAMANASPALDNVQLGGDKVGADKEYNVDWKQEVRGRW